MDTDPEPLEAGGLPPSPLTFDQNAPVSGHVPASDAGAPVGLAVEHDWVAAAAHVFPVLRPEGTHGVDLGALSAEELAAEGLKKHALPLLDAGPAGLAVAYALRSPAFDVLINADHLLAWGIDAGTLRDTAMDNLRAWSGGAPWSDELSGERRLVSSDTAEGGDAARILLAEVRDHLVEACGGSSRVLVGLPDRDLLVAGSLQPDDQEFAGQLAAFIAEVSDGAHEPIDGGLFELVGEGNELVRYAS